MPIIPIRNSNAYIGIGKQTVQGTPVAPTIFPRWLDGSQLDMALKTEVIREGDGTRRVAQYIKNQQYAKVKLVCFPRPVEVGFLENAALGISADTVTAATVVRTVLTSAAAGSTTIILDANTGLTSIGTAIINAAPGTATEEVLTITTPAGAGTTFTLANSATTKFMHQGAVSTTSATTITAGSSQTIVVAAPTNILVGSSLLFSGGTGTPETVVVTAVAGTSVTAFFTNIHSGAYTITVAADAVRTATTHTMSDKSDGNFYTVEVGLGSLFGGAGMTVRITDCKVDLVKRTSKAGTLLRIEFDWSGIATVVQASPATVTLENHSPFYYVTGAWTLDGSTTGDAPYIESFDIAQKNALDVAIQSEKLILDSIIFGSVDVTLTFQAIFQNPAHVYLTYFGNATLPGTGATDAQAIGAGSLVLTFTQVDGFHTLSYTLTTLHYNKAAPPVPKLDGKHLVLPMSADSVSNQGINLNVIQTTVANAQTAAY